MIVRLLAAGLVLALAVPAAAQDPPPKPEDPQQSDEPVVYEETVVVSASKVEQELVNAPAAVSVVTTETIQNSPATNIGDLLRAVPGLNVSQTSARDINLTSRGATSTLSTSQLALVDGRSVYLDFFGMVMWDLVPNNPGDIKQIEVIRGPASAVWGANAMTGVVNVITKTPRELAAAGGTSFTLGFGTFDRDVEGSDQDAGSTFYVNGSHAAVMNDRWSFKLAAGYLSSDPFARPTGTIPNQFNTPYPTFSNEGTSQPKFDARVDYDFENGGRMVFSGGLAGTEGIIHTGIGPFDIDSSSRMTYFSSRYQNGGTRVGFFTNILNGDAVNLLQRGPTGEFLPLGFDTQTFDVDVSDVRALGTRNVFSYGGNYRHNGFDITLAPNGEDRNEGGLYVQDEIFLSDHFRWVIGGRVDSFSSIDGAVFSPRTTFMIKPTNDHTIRLSFNRAFRAPSFINNHIETAIINQLNLGLINPALAGRVFNFPVQAIGNPDLSEETMTALEVGYTGQFANNRILITAAVYRNETEDAIFFTQSARYGAANPPPGWATTGLPLLALEAIAAAGSPLPSQFTYRNLGTVEDVGIELGIDAAITDGFNIFTNYSYQRDPEVEGFALSEVNLPPNNRFNAGFNFSRGRFLGNLAVSYTDEAFWQDVLDARFSGVTDAYTMINGGFGVRWAGDRLVTAIKVTNLANEEILQHIFGDITKRQIVGELRFTF
jgi:outer membrane receptor protein involved in Fe transport